jgi:hypothetical protein
VATYSQVTLAQATTQVSTLLDDLSARYWTVPEIQYAIWEGLRVWGALTSYWRSRGAFQFLPTSPTPFVDLSSALPTLRTRSWTLNQLTQEIQYALLENPSGIAGTGMSGQVSIQSILLAIARSRNRFVLDAKFPISIHEAFGAPPAPSGTITFSQSSVFVHRVQWQDLLTGEWVNLWREDEWALDHANQDWPLDPSGPQTYSEAVLAPLTLQLSPPPLASGSCEALTVDSLKIDLTDPASTFNIPDEWVHALKWGALSDLLTAESQLHDPLRAQYAESRYQQAGSFARDARSVLRVQANGVPMPIDTLRAIDAGTWYWRNTYGTPYLAGVLYDLVCPVPLPSAPTGATADVVQSAPIPLLPPDFIPLGFEDIDHIINYATHILCFKCGGKEFTDTIPGYDAFMSAVAGRKGVNAAKIRYLTPLFAQPTKEQYERPDRIEVQTNA